LRNITENSHLPISHSPVKKKKIRKKKKNFFCKTALGAALLWMGWFGFNAGSALAAGMVATSAVASTQIAACVSGKKIYFIANNYIQKKKNKKMEKIEKIFKFF
jgi:ammonia channel protein AmtB